jgi:hypothetical protein
MITSMMPKMMFYLHPPVEVSKTAGNQFFHHKLLARFKEITWKPNWPISCKNINNIIIIIIVVVVVVVVVLHVVVVVVN